MKALVADNNKNGILGNIALAAEEKYRGLFDNANDAVITTDTAGCVTSWNKTAEKLFGWTAQEITGKRLVEALATPETIEEKEKMICEILPDTTAGLEIACMRRDGTKIDVSVTISPLLDVNRNIAGKSLIIRDITEHKRHEIALRKSEEFTRTVLNSMNDLIMVIDVRDFSIVGVNRLFQKEYRVKEEDIVGKKCYEITHKIPEACYLRNEICPLLESVQTGKDSTVEHVHIGKNGQKKYLEVSTSPIKDDFGKIVQVIHVARDITGRREAELKLRLHSEIMKNLTEGVYLIRLDDGIIIYTNPKFEEMFGYAPDEMIGKNVSIVYAPTDRTPEKTKEDIIDVLKKTGEWHGEVKNIKKDGTQFWCYANVSLFNHSEIGNVLISVHSDITQRKKSQEALYETEARFRSVAESANDAIITADEKGDILFWNNGAQKIFGYESKEVTGKPMTILIPEMFREAHIKGIERLHAKGESHIIGKTVELSGLRKDGIEFPIELSLSTWNVGEQTYYSGMIRNITERKRIAQELAHSEEKHRLLYEDSSDAIMLLDEKGFFDCNNATLLTFGFSNKEEFLKKHPSQVSPPVQPDGMDSNTAANNKMSEAFRKGSNHFEWVHRKKNGEDFYADVLLSAFNLKGKKVLQATIRDISERKKAQALLFENERLVLANEAKSEFLTVMSHELRTPMNSVIGFSDLLKQKKNGDLNEKQEGYLDNILSSGKHLLELINEILDLTQIEAGKMEMLLEKISVPEAVDETLNLMKKNAEQRKITLNKEIDPSLDFIEADRKKLNQILLNLVSNAIKFSKDEGGTVTVKAKRVDDCAQFSVLDTGIGIKEEDMSKLFREFQQIDMGISRKYGGTGLGLAITKRLVQMHRGRIWAKSKYGEGTTFTFTLPINEKKHEPEKT